MPLAAALLLGVGLTGGYRRVERVAILFGLFEFAFFAVAYTAHPTVADIVSGSIDIPLGDTQILVPGRRQYRRGDHAVDDFLPAVGGRG